MASARHKRTVRVDAAVWFVTFADPCIEVRGEVTFKVTVLPEGSHRHAHYLPAAGGVEQTCAVEVVGVEGRGLQADWQMMTLVAPGKKPLPVSVTV